MNFAAIAALSVAMSTDAFAVAVGRGAALQKPALRDALKTGLVFGIVEGITPLIGWLLGRAAAPYVEAWDHWIAFTLLTVLGLKMIRDGFSPEEAAPQEGAGSLLTLAVTGLATSIDAMAVGVSLAFLGADILVTALAIGCSTFLFVTLGILVGRTLGSLVGKRAEIGGGVILILIGCIILYEHVFAL